MILGHGTHIDLEIWVCIKATLGDFITRVNWVYIEENIDSQYKEHIEEI